MHFKIAISILEFICLESEAKNPNFKSQFFGLENIFQALILTWNIYTYMKLHIETKIFNFWDFYQFPPKLHCDGGLKVKELKNNDRYLNNLHIFFFPPNLVNIEAKMCFHPHLTPP